jgi:hypothetical protein
MHPRPSVDADRPRRAAALAAFALAACVAVPPGIRAADPEKTDRVALRTRPPGLARIAVLPFGGLPAHRRPAEEWVAVQLARSSGSIVLGPWAVARWYRAGVGEPAALVADVEAWTRAYRLRFEGMDDDPDAPPPPREEIRKLAAALGADAVVLGQLIDGGDVAELVLVDGTTGDAVAVLRRAGERAAADLGIHELAMSATDRALQDVFAVLRTPAGQTPAVTVQPPRGEIATPGMESW